MDAFDLSFLLMFVNASKVGGWTRALIGALLTAAIARWPALSSVLDPATQTALGVAASGIVVGVWSHVAKRIAAQNAANAQGPGQTGAPQYGPQGQVKSGAPLRSLALWFVVGAAALLACVVNARAQTSPVVTKAPPALSPTTPCTQQFCSGPYIGGALYEAGSNFNVVSSGATTSSNQFSGGLDAGFQFWNDKWFLAAEFDASYGLVQNGAVAGGGNSALWGIGAIAKIGYSLSSLFGAGVSGTASPVLPSSLQNAMIAPYVILGNWDRPWGSGFATGAGVEALLAKNWTLSVDYIHVNYNNAAVNPNVNQQTEDMIRAAVDYHFGL